MSYPITHVAIIWDDKCYSLPKPLRHGNVIRAKSLLDGDKDVPYDKDIQGFLDSSGAFLDRYQAYKRVMEIGQHIVDQTQLRGGRLFSEDVWETEGKWNGEPGSPEYELYWSTHSNEALLRLLKISDVKEAQ